MNGSIETDLATKANDRNNNRCPNMNPCPLFDLRRVWFTTHALEQFHARYGARVCRGFTPLELLSWAEEDRTISPEWEQKRLMLHDDEEARYFIFERWRFVILEVGEILSVVTFEERYIPLHPKKSWLRSKKWRRRQKD